MRDRKDGSVRVGGVPCAATSVASAGVSSADLQRKIDIKIAAGEFLGALGISHNGRVNLVQLGEWVARHVCTEI